MGNEPNYFKMLKAYYELGINSELGSSAHSMFMGLLYKANSLRFRRTFPMSNPELARLATISERSVRENRHKLTDLRMDGVPLVEYKQRRKSAGIYTIVYELLDLDRTDMAADFAVEGNSDNADGGEIRRHDLPGDGDYDADGGEIRRDHNQTKPKEPNHQPDADRSHVPGEPGTTEGGGDFFLKAKELLSRYGVRARLLEEGHPPEWICAAIKNYEEDPPRDRHDPAKIIVTIVRSEELRGKWQEQEKAKEAARAQREEQAKIEKRRCVINDEWGAPSKENQPCRNTDSDNAMVAQLLGHSEEEIRAAVRRVKEARNESGEGFHVADVLPKLYGFLVQGKEIGTPKDAVWGRASLANLRAIVEPDEKHVAEMDSGEEKCERGNEEMSIAELLTACTHPEIQ